MNKTQKAILIAVIAIIVGFILLGAALFIAGSPANWDLKWFHFNDSDEEQITLEADTEDLTVQNGEQLQLTEFSAIELRNLACDIEISPTTEAQFSLSFQGLELEPAQKGDYLLIYKGGDRDEVNLELKDGVLRLSADKLPDVKSFTNLRSLIREQHRKLTLLVPEDWQGKVEASSLVGDLSLWNCQVSELDISMPAGDVDVSNVKCDGQARLELLAGDLDVHDSAFGAMDIDLMLGDLDLYGLACADLNVMVKAGDVDLTDVACADLELTLNAGDLDLTDLACGGLKVDMDLGDCSFERLAPQSADISLRAGEVMGSLKGSAGDYATDCQVRLGECSLSAAGSGSRPVRIRVDAGSIDLDYEK
ncbi:MAG: DUF4097 family beta strand repeat protein [Firmicutes bacterium]|nr:DUF4097 family beta strand repeat protein [Bacillota bacterium]